MNGVLRNLALILTMWWSCLNSTAQIDSALVEEKARQAYGLIDEARAGMESSPSGTVDKLEEALQIAISIGDKRIEAYCYSTLGAFQFNLKNYSRASQYYKESIQLFNEVGDRKGKYTALQAMALAQESAGNLKPAVTSYKEALDIASRSGNQMDMVRLMVSLGKLHQLLKEPGKSADYYQKALAIEEQRNNKKGQIEILNYLGMVHQDLGDEKKALQYFGKASTIAQETNDVESISQSFQGLGQFYQEQKDLEKELEVLMEAIRLNREAGNQIGVARNSLRIATILAAQGEFSQAVPYLKESIQSARKTRNTDMVIEAKRLLADVYEKLGEVNLALEIVRQYAVLEDSVMRARQKELKEAVRFSDELSQRLNEIKNLQYQGRLKSDSISAIRTEKELIELKLDRQRQENNMRQTVIYGLLAVLLILGVSAFLIMKSAREKRRANRLLALQHLRTQMNPHFIFNSLNSINSFIARNDERSANKYLSEFSRLMRAVLENSKYEFVTMSSELDVLKLYLDLEHLRFSEKFDYEFKFDPDLMSEDILVPPMLVQPYIENSIWHGLRYKETKGLLKVHFSRKEDHILCVIEDNGIGRKRSAELKTRNQKQGESTAMKNIEQRLRIINEVHRLDLKVSIFDIDNDTGTGTRVEIMIPYISNDMAA